MALHCFPFCAECFGVEAGRLIGARGCAQEALHREEELSALLAARRRTAGVLEVALEQAGERERDLEVRIAAKAEREQRAAEALAGAEAIARQILEGVARRRGDAEALEGQLAAAEADCAALRARVEKARGAERELQFDLRRATAAAVRAHAVLRERSDLLLEMKGKVAEVEARQEELALELREQEGVAAALGARLAAQQAAERAAQAQLAESRVAQQAAGRDRAFAEQQCAEVEGEIAETNRRAAVLRNQARCRRAAGVGCGRRKRDESELSLRFPTPLHAHSSRRLERRRRLCTGKSRRSGRKPCRNSSRSSGNSRGRSRSSSPRRAPALCADQRTHCRWRQARPRRGCWSGRAMSVNIPARSIGPQANAELDAQHEALEAALKKRDGTKEAVKAAEVRWRRRRPPVPTFAFHAVFLR